MKYQNNNLFNVIKRMPNSCHQSRKYRKKIIHFLFPVYYISWLGEEKEKKCPIETAFTVLLYFFFHSFKFKT